MSAGKFFISAGDLSGDNAASRLVTELLKINSPLETFGLGGTKLGKLGQEQLASPEDLAVIGFWEVAKRVSFFSKLLDRAVSTIKERKPQAVILVDYPGFNLRLAERIRPLGIPIIYYISPQIWAWGKKRIDKIRKLIDLMLVILPFEESFYEEHDVNCKFVGHYLLEDIPDEYISSEPPKENRLAILPGSRPQEIERMLQPMLESMKFLHFTRGITSKVVGIEGRFDYEPIVSQYRNDGVELSYEDSRKIISESRYVLTKSGTSTLEAGIIGRPMVIVYRTGYVTYQIARRLVKLDSIGLVNLVLGEPIVQELIQREASAARMALEISLLADNPDAYEEMRGELNRIPDLLGGIGASERAAHLIVELLESGKR